jgi:UDP-N-acetyl-D-glucosamine dehydrogenase
MKMKHLITKIENNTAKIGIIGMGYVGLPLAMLFARKFHVIGYDTNVNTIKSLCNGVSHIQDVKDLVLNKHLNTEFYPTDDYTKIKNCDFIVICVPTPLNEYKEPDLSY